MGQVSTSKQRTPHPLGSPTDKVGAKGANQRSKKKKKCIRPPFGGTVQTTQWKEGQTKVSGHSGDFLQAQPRENRASPEAKASSRQ